MSTKDDPDTVPSGHGFQLITGHSLSKHVWLRSSPGGRREIKAPPASTPESRAAMREEAEDWGPSFDVDDLLAATDYEEEDGMQLMMRRMNEQFDHALGDRRAKYARAATRDMLKFFEGSRAFRSLLTLEVDIRIRFVKPRIWRRLLVPAAMSLHAFIDRVLIVAFGYARGEHSYVANLPAAAYPGRRLPRPNEDVCFVPEHAGTVDMMHLHMYRGGHCAVPAHRVLLCDPRHAQGHLRPRRPHRAPRHARSGARARRVSGAPPREAAGWGSRGHP